ncbi:MAG: hypothetical protein ACXWV1_00115 [Chitinophagaceae bacterium]
MENQETYWSDYTEFISLAEAVTGLSPSELIERYEILITELETNNQLEWIYENMQDEFTIVKIHQLINHERLKDNILKNEFKEKIRELDARMKKFLIPSISNNENWWVEFKEDKIDWAKVE